MQCSCCSCAMQRSHNQQILCYCAFPSFLFLFSFSVSHFRVQGSDICSSTPPTVTCSYPASATGCTLNADGSVSVQNVLENNGIVITCVGVLFVFVFLCAHLGLCVAVSASTGLNATCSSTVSVVATTLPVVTCSTSGQAQCGATDVVLSATVRFCVVVCLIVFVCV